MNRRGLLLAMACTLGCRTSAGGNDYLGAAITAGAAVAGAAVYREATNGCWASCAVGEACDEVSGLCVPLACEGGCPADLVCAWVEGKQQCVSSRRATVDRLEPVEEAARPSSEARNPALCLAAGITDCQQAPYRSQPEAVAVDVISGGAR